MNTIFSDKGTIINNIRHLSPTEAHSFLMDDAILIDVREEFMSHIKTFDVPEILIFPYSKFGKLIKDLPKDKALIFADATGVKSKPATELAIREGYTNIANLAGGLLEWERDGLPVITYQKIKVSGRNRCEFIDRRDL